MSFSRSSNAVRADSIARAFDGRTGRRDRYRPPRRRFVQLGAAFLTRLPAAPLPDPYVVAVSADAAAQLGIDPASVRKFAQDPAFAAFFAGNPTREWPAETLPYATVYSGHQFGVWAGQLGDGRAIGLGEIDARRRARSNCS